MLNGTLRERGRATVPGVGLRGDREREYGGMKTVSIGRTREERLVVASRDIKLDCCIRCKDAEPGANTPRQRWTERCVTGKRTRNSNANLPQDDLSGM